MNREMMGTPSSTQIMNIVQHGVLEGCIPARAFNPMGVTR